MRASSGTGKIDFDPMSHMIRRTPHLFLLASLILCLPAQTEEIKTFPEYTVEVEPEMWPYSTADKHFHLWVPEDPPVVQGLLLFVFHGIGQKTAENEEIRKLAEELGCGVVGFDKFYLYPGGPGENHAPANVLTDALKELAKTSSRPEVAHAPVITFGHSNATNFAAGFPSREPDRTIAWIAFKSAFGGQFSIPEIYGIPGMILSGEEDESYFSDQLATVRKLRHQHGALMHIVVEPDGGHGLNKGSYSILKAFIQSVFGLRVPPDADPRQGPVALNPVKESDGWLGQTLATTRFRGPDRWEWLEPTDTRHKLEIAPYDEYPGDKRFASWLPTGEYAVKWQEFGMKADLPNWAEPVTVPERTAEYRFAQAQRLEESSPTAAAAAYASLVDTEYGEQAAARLADEDFITRLEARKILEELWVAQLSLGNSRARRFQEENAETLAAISKIAAPLLERYPDTADAQTVRRILEHYGLPVP